MLKVIYSLFPNISLQYSRRSVEQPIRFQLSVVYTSLGIGISNTIEDNSSVNMPYLVIDWLAISAIIMKLLNKQYVHQQNKPHV